MTHTDHIVCDVAATKSIQKTEEGRRSGVRHPHSEHPREYHAMIVEQRTEWYARRMRGHGATALPYLEQVVPPSKSLRGYRCRPFSQGDRCLPTASATLWQGRNPSDSGLAYRHQSFCLVSSDGSVAMSDDYSFLRTGLSGETTTSDEQDTINTQQVVSILMIFLEDSVETAATYAVGSGRRRVTADDQIKALQYQARMFFQQHDLESRSVASLEAVREAWDDDEEDEEDESEEGDERDTDDDEDESCSRSDGDDDEAGARDEDNPAHVSVESMTAAKKMVARVDAIASSWHLYAPDDPLLVRIKEAVDRTISRFR
jgi:hypothetical protein